MYTPDTRAMVFTIMGLGFREYYKSGIGRAGAFCLISKGRPDQRIWTRLPVLTPRPVLTPPLD